MINYVPHHVIDKEKWDRCIQNSFNEIVYAFSWYLDIVADEWDALIEDDYKRVMPLTGNKKGGIKYIYQPFFTQQLGVFSISKLTDEKVSEFLAEIPKKYKLIELNLNTHNAPLPHHHLKEMQNFELDLIPPYEMLTKGYSKNTRRNIRKAEKEKIQIMKNIKPEEVIRIFREHRGKDIHQLNEHAYQVLKQLTYSMIYKGKAAVWGAFSENNTLQAGAIFIHSKNKWIFLFSGTTDQARSNGAMPFLIDRFIRKYAGTKTTLDFEGSNDDNLARFYSSFGSTRSVYYHYAINHMPLWMKIIVNTIKKIKHK